MQIQKLTLKQRKFVLKAATHSPGMIVIGRQHRPIGDRDYEASIQITDGNTGGGAILLPDTDV